MRRELRCKDVQRHLSDYIDGDLAADAHAATDSHRDICPGCDRDLRELEATVRLLRGLPEPETPPMLAANVMRRIRAGETRPSLLGRLRQTLISVLEPSFVLPASAMAVAALVVVSVQGPIGSGWWKPAEGPAVVDSQPAGMAALAEPGTGIAERARSLASRRMASAPRASLAASSARPGSAGRSPFADGLVAELRASTASMPASAAPPPAVGWGGVTGGSAVRYGGGTPVAMPVARPALPGVFDAAGLRSAAQPGPGSDGTRGPDVRDQWLAAALDRPEELARFLAAKSLAEQELWVERLAGRARDRGLLSELLEVLNATGDEAARLLAEDFRAAVANRGPRPER